MGSFDNRPSSDDYRRDALRTSRAAFEADGGITGPRPPSDDVPDHGVRNFVVLIIVALIIVWIAFHLDLQDYGPCADCVRGS
jgi:hypothetical protein